MRVERIERRRLSRARHRTFELLCGCCDVIQWAAQVDRKEGAESPRNDARQDVTKPSNMQFRGCPGA